LEPAAVHMQQAALHMWGKKKESETWRQNAVAQRGLQQELAGGEDPMSFK